jgi:hypothetical protein
MKHVNELTKKLFLCILALFVMDSAQAQLSGTYTVGGTSPDYSTLSAAISDLNSSGVSGAVVFNIRDGVHSGSSWRGTIGNVAGASSANTITFQSQSGNKANCVLQPSGTSSANYVFYLNNAKYVTIKNLTLNNTGSTYGCDIRLAGSASYNTVENCVLQGHTGNSTSTNKARIYATSFSSGINNTFRGNNIERGSYGVYLRGSNTSSTTNGHVFEDNVFDQNYYYSFYGYYTGDIAFNGNTVNRSGSGTYYAFDVSYNRNKLEVKGNEFNVSTTSTTYVTRTYFTNYYSNSQTEHLEMTNNTYNVTSTTNTVYVTYHYYGRKSYYANNTINATSNSTSGYIRNYYMYYDQNGTAENNSFNLYKAGGYIYNYMVYYGTADTFRNNKIDITGNSYSYNYMTYFCQNYSITDNEVDIQTTNRTIYGAYVYYYGGTFARNKISCESSTGAVYGIYSYYLNNAELYNNVIATKSNSTNYSILAYYPYPTTKMYNNTIYNEGTSSSSYNLYLYNSSTSYGMNVHNNIFYKTGAGGYNVYYYRTTNVKSDYNIYYKPSGNIFYRITPSANRDNLYDWRSLTGEEKNSLIYNVPFTNAANKDFTIDGTSPAAWAVNGRGIHIAGDTMDITGAPRAKTPADGVPDLGAYEVSPTSTPPNADASPANPVANSTQVFTFGQDTVATIDWGADVPATYTMRQYTGVQAAPMPPGVGRMYFYTAGTPATWVHGHQPNVYYKEPWTGDIPGGDVEAVIARSSNNGAWEGYNYTNAATDTVRNILRPANTLDSIGSYTGVQNGRIGIRCVENPKGISFTNITAIAADIEWQPVFNPIGYQVIVKLDKKYPTDAEWAASNMPTTNSLAAGGLIEDKTYYVFIRSICGIKDTSGFSMDSFTTLITCHTPVITISGLNGTRAVVSWQLVKTAHKYEYAMNKSATPPAVGTDINKNSMLAPFLDEGTEYYVHVRAHCSSIYDKSDWATAKFNTWAVNVNNVNGEGAQLAVYPNPVQQEMVITIGGTVQEGTITVLDMTGKLLKTQTVNSNTAKVNVTELPAGMYIVQYTDDNRREQVKFSKQ